MLNINNKNTYFYVDDYGMMTCEGGQHDSIGFTYDACMAYGVENFVETLNGCYDLWGNVYRHPSVPVDGYNDCSRDHVSYLVMSLRMAGIDIGPDIKWNFSDKFSLSLPLWAYCRGYYNLYYLFQIAQYIPLWLWFKVAYWISRFEREPDQIKYLERDPYERTRWDKFFTEIMYPRVYILWNHSNQVYHLKDSLGKRILQTIFRSLTPTHNYAMLLLNNAKLSFYERITALNYKPMTHSRWSGTFVKERNATKHELTGDTENCLDEDFLNSL